MAFPMNENAREASEGMADQSGFGTMSLGSLLPGNAWVEGGGGLQPRDDLDGEINT